MTGIGIALSKGRILEETGPLLARVGLSPREDPERSRKLIIPTARRDVKLIVVRASDTFELLAKNALGEVTMATPAISEGRLFFRTKGHLVAVGR